MGVETGSTAPVPDQTCAAENGARTENKQDGTTGRPVLDFCRHCNEGLLDVGCVLRASFEERQAELVCELLGRVVVNGLL